MISGNFRYERPESLDEALDLLYEYGDVAEVLAGGQELLPRLSLGGVSPEVIIDIGRLKPLMRLRSLDGLVSLGSLVTHTQVCDAPEIRDRIGLLKAVASKIGGGPQVRNRGTIGGSIASRNPVYDYPACLLVLEATVHLARRDAHRSIAFDEFNSFGTGQEACRGELLTEISIKPPARNHHFAYEKLKFSDGCYLIAGAACIATVDEEGCLRGVRIAVGGVSSQAVRLSNVESLVEGKNLNEKLLDEVAMVARRAIVDPITDTLADGAYRRRVTGPLVQRALRRVGKKEEKT